MHAVDDAKQNIRIRLADWLRQSRAWRRHVSHVAVTYMAIHISAEVTSKTEEQARDHNT